MAEPDATRSRTAAWPPKLGHALWSEANGKISLDHAVTGTRAGARYGLATMLLAAGGENLFSARALLQEVCVARVRDRGTTRRPRGSYRVLRNGVFRRNSRTVSCW